MNKEDARKLPSSAQAEKRKLAIKLWKQNHTSKAIAEIVEVSTRAVTGWIKRYQAEGDAVLEVR